MPHVANSAEIAALAPDREPGSSGDNAVADLVTARFKTILTGAVSEQRFDAEVDGESVSLRNVLLSLPGNGDGVVVIVAGRDSPDAQGAAWAAALDRLFATTFFSAGAGRIFTEGLYRRGAPEPGPVDAELARLFARIGA